MSIKETCRFKSCNNNLHSCVDLIHIVANFLAFFWVWQKYCEYGLFFFPQLGKKRLSLARVSLVNMCIFTAGDSHAKLWLCCCGASWKQADTLGPRGAARPPAQTDACQRVLHKAIESSQHKSHVQFYVPYRNGVENKPNKLALCRFGFGLPPHTLCAHLAASRAHPADHV